MIWEDSREWYLNSPNWQVYNSDILSGIVLILSPCPFVLLSRLERSSPVMLVNVLAGSVCFMACINHGANLIIDPKFEVLPIHD